MVQPVVFAPHVTVAAVAETDGRYLIVREYVAGVERINNPAGHVEDGEAPETAVAREVMEETGYRFVPEALGGIYFWRAPQSRETFVRFNFIGRCTDHDQGAELDTGIIAPAWMTLAELDERTSMLRSPLVVQSFRDYAAGIRYPLSAVTALIGP